MLAHFVKREIKTIFKFKPSPAKFLKWNNPPSIFGTVNYQFWDGYQDENLKSVSQQCRLNSTANATPFKINFLEYYFIY